MRSLETKQTECEWKNRSLLLRIKQSWYRANNVGSRVCSIRLVAWVLEQAKRTLSCTCTHSVNLESVCSHLLLSLSLPLSFQKYTWACKRPDEKKSRIKLLTSFRVAVITGKHHTSSDVNGEKIKSIHVSYLQWKETKKWGERNVKKEEK